VDLRRGMLTGIALTLVSAAITFAYLSSITINDGLEALIFIPIIGLLFTATGSLGGWRGRTWNWVIGQAIGFAVLVSLFLLVTSVISMATDWRNVRSGGPFPTEAWTYGTILLVSSASTIATLSGCTLACGTVGWLAGSSLSRRRLRRLPAPPTPPQA